MNKRYYWTLVLVPLTVILVSVCASQYDPNEIAGNTYLAPSLMHFFGTDYLGRDLFARTANATSSAFFIVTVATLTSLSVATVYGAYAGFRGGAVSRTMMTILNIVDSIPDFLLAIALLLLFNGIQHLGGNVGLLITIIIISWTGVARVIMNETSKVMQRGYVAFARRKGAGWRHIFTYHLLPSIKGSLLLIALQRVPIVILLCAFLGFIGIGFQPPTANLGKMISDGIIVFRSHPHILFFPTLFLVLLTLTFGVLGLILSSQDHETE